MVKNVTEYTKKELEEKIEAIKAERERTAEALKKYEEELERREPEPPLGVPCKLKCNMYYFLNSKNEVVYPSTIDNKWDALDRQLACNVFESYKSAEKHAEMLLAWRKDGVLANSNDEQIDIKVLLPLLKKGYVAMDKNNGWHWYKEKPYISEYYFCWNTGSQVSFIGGFNLKPAEDWRNSLMECGL